MASLKDLEPMDEVIERLRSENRSFYLSILATRCIEAIASLGDEDARKQLRQITDASISYERHFDEREKSVGA